MTLCKSRLHSSKEEKEEKEQQQKENNKYRYWQVAEAFPGTIQDSRSGRAIVMCISDAYASFLWLE
jgi:hypothetical protein